MGEQGKQSQENHNGSLAASLTPFILHTPVQDSVVCAPKTLQYGFPFFFFLKKHTSSSLEPHRLFGSDWATAGLPDLTPIHQSNSSALGFSCIENDRKARKTGQRSHFYIYGVSGGAGCPPVTNCVCEREPASHGLYDYIKNNGRRKKQEKKCK